MQDQGTGFSPKRKWGQNFLINSGACDTLVQAFSPRPDDLVIEIGPGKGALTRRLAARVGRLTAVEVDPDLAARLRDDLASAPSPSGAPAPAVEIVEADILMLDLDQLLDRLGAVTGRPARVVGNLPYNIATAVLLKLVTRHDRIRDLLLMVQREVAERIASPPRRKSYGSLSVLCQTWAGVDSILRLGPGSFRPSPRVDSEAIRLRLRDPGGAAGRNAEGYASLVRAAFAHRRTTLLNNLAVRFGHDAAAALIGAAGLLPGRRAEEIPVEGFLALAESFAAAEGRRAL